MIRNRFRDQMARDCYDAYVQHFYNRRYLFNPDGSGNRSNSWRYAFWSGFYGWQKYETRADKQTTAYPAWCAGRDCATLFWCISFGE